ncbi:MULTISPECIES: CoxG family protein [Lichenihabitans]|uniref:CoxG family protein n=1 Tax=Lichenihabitans TaxID=2723776 RepID=UPI001036C1C5|nr:MULTISPECIES: carbon monoxide dehydrogenase subunit G [Lichenihabitans]UDL94680.1 carbon monoxide dehydrogenase subunit G [Lichenihabitans sp. PAMC28606]
MTMAMTGEVHLPADPATVWKKLNDPSVMQACIPGCHALVRTGETSFEAIAKFKIGPLTATFKGRIDLSNIDAPHGYRIAGEGQGGIAGFAKGAADVTLSEAVGGGTILRYAVQANVGGKLAKYGGGLVNGTAKKTADRFFANFSAAIS